MHQTTWIKIGIFVGALLGATQLYAETNSDSVTDSTDTSMPVPSDDVEQQDMD